MVSMATEVPQHVIATGMWQVPLYLLFHDADVRFWNHSTRVYPVHTKVVHNIARTPNVVNMDMGR